MKRSARVPATMIVALAAGLSVTGCSPRRECRDAAGRPRPEIECRRGTPGANWVGVRTGGFGGGSAGGGYFGG